jgi:hypothetical protein
MIEHGLYPSVTAIERKGDNIIFVTGLSVIEIAPVIEIKIDFSCPEMTDIDRNFATMAADVQKDGIAYEVTVNNGN